LIALTKGSGSRARDKKRKRMGISSNEFPLLRAARLPTRKKKRRKRERRVRNEREKAAMG